MTTDASEAGATIALLRYFLSICNEALARWRAMDRDGSVVAAIIDPVEGTTFVVEVTDEAATAVARSGVGVRRGSFLALPESNADPAVRCTISRAALEDVWANASEYIDHPWRLDWGWLRGGAPGVA
jgi:hypothetical protein